MDGAFLVEKVQMHINHGDEHGDVGGYGGTLDAPLEAKDEDGGEDHVHTGAYEVGQHRFLGIARGAHDVAEREGEVVDEQAGQHVEHEVAGVGQRLLAGTKPAQHVVDEDGQQSQVEGAQRQGHHQAVAQDELGGALAALPQHYGGACSGSTAYEHAKGRRDVHHREGDCQARDGVGTHALPNEHTVDDVVDRHHHHAHHRWQAVFPQQLAYRGFIKFL